MRLETRIVTAGLAAAIGCFSLIGCATTNSSYGRDFPTEPIKSIVKGKTTPDDILKSFGEPFNKTVSSGFEIWTYSFFEVSAHAQSFILVTQAQSSSHHKSLTVTFQNGVVSNYSYSVDQNPNGSSLTTSAP